MYNEENCRFLKTHEWAFVEGENAVVGISNHAQEEISDIVFVDLPKVGRIVKAGENCCVIESVKSASEIYAPVSGDANQTGKLLTNYRSYLTAFLPFLGEKEEEELPEISPLELEEAFLTLSELAATYDFDSVSMVVRELKGYRIPEEQREKTRQVLEAAEKPDWERLKELL